MLKKKCKMEGNKFKWATCPIAVIVDLGIMVFNIIGIVFFVLLMCLLEYVVA